MKIYTQEKLVKRTPRLLDVGQAIRNCVGYIAFTQTLRGKLLQKQARQVVKTLF